MLIITPVTSVSVHILLHHTGDLLPQLRLLSGIEIIWQPEMCWQSLDLKLLSISSLIIKICKEERSDCTTSDQRSCSLGTTPLTVTSNGCLGKTSVTKQGCGSTSLEYFFSFQKIHSSRIS